MSSTVSSVPEAAGPLLGDRYLTGNFAPVDTEVTAFDLPVIEGAIPPSLDGRYLRNGPNPLAGEDRSAYHWFTGSGMVHGVRLRAGTAEWYRNRWVRSPEVARRLGEDVAPNPWDDDVFAANTNVIVVGGTTMAIVEAGSPPVELSDELETLRISDLGGSLPKAFSAHPKRNPTTGELHVAAYWWGWGNQMQYLVVGTDGRVRTTVDVPLPGAPMVHDIAITERWAVLFDLPCLFDLEAAMGGARLPYTWQPDYGARLGLLPIDGAGAAQWFEIEPCYVYHPLNAYEDADGRVVVDVARHPSTFAADRHGPNEGPVTLDRYTLDPAQGRVGHERLDDRSQEFPRHDERILGRPHRFGYTAAFESDGRQITFGGAIKHDVGAGTTETHDYGPGRSTGELVFVPESADAAEDEGWLLSFVHDASDNHSELVILHAQDFGGAPVARIALPQRVPNGFHGNWIPTAV